MRIVFDASSMPAQRAGAGVYMYQLGRALAAHAGEHPLLLLDRFGAFSDLRGVAGLTLGDVPASGRAARFAWEQSGLPFLARDFGAEVLHGPHHGLPLLPTSAAGVVTIHDITFDLLPRRYTLARRWYMRLITRIGLARARRVIVPSAFVRDGLTLRYGVAPARIVVVPESAAPGIARIEDGERLAATRARYALPERFILSVGTREPGKNRGLLRGAVAALRRRGLPHRLVVVGGRGWLEAETDEPDEAVLYTGYVPDADLAALYSLAEAFVFPSLLEGFGLPPLEALACGLPVLSSRRPAMPEVLGDAALYADPRRIDDWADALEQLLTDQALRESMIERGQARAALYSWERAARETLAVYRAALGET